MPGAVYEFIETVPPWQPRVPAPGAPHVIMIISVTRNVNDVYVWPVQCLELEPRSAMLKKRWHVRAKWRRVS